MPTLRAWLVASLISALMYSSSLLVHGPPMVTILLSGGDGSLALGMGLPLLLKAGGGEGEGLGQPLVGPVGEARRLTLLTTDLTLCRGPSCTLGPAAGLSGSFTLGPTTWVAWSPSDRNSSASEAVMERIISNGGGSSWEESITSREASNSPRGVLSSLVGTDFTP